MGIYSNNIDVFVILVSCLHQLSCKSICLDWLTEVLISLHLIASSLGDEKSQMHSAGILKNISVRILKQSKDLLSRRMFSNLLRLLASQKLGGMYFERFRRPPKERLKWKTERCQFGQAYSQRRGIFSTLLAFNSASTYMAWGNDGPHQPCRSTRVWLETFRLRVHCNYN